MGACGAAIPLDWWGMQPVESVGSSIARVSTTEKAKETLDNKLRRLTLAVFGGGGGGGYRAFRFSHKVS